MNDPTHYGYQVGTAAEFVKLCGSAFVTELISRAGRIDQYVLWDNHATPEDSFLITGPDRDQIIADWNQTIAFPGEPFRFEGRARNTDHFEVGHGRPFG